MMKYHVLPCELAKFLFVKIKLNFLTDILVRAQLRTVQAVSRSVHKSAHFLSDMAHLLFVSVPSVVKNRENYPSPYAHDLAV